MPCRTWWRNCASKPDAEIQDIDRMEEDISPMTPGIARVRELISTLELCHHKADRWVHNIIGAISSGETAKGLGTRAPGQNHPIEQIWQNACGALSAWCAGCPAASVDVTVGTVPASRLLAHLGQRSALKEWQVQRIVERIRSFINWPQSRRNASARYVPILECGGEYESTHRTECPDHYQEHEGFWQATVRTIIRDTVDGKAAKLSLGVAIDMLMPCHWNFVGNLEIVLKAVGGDLAPSRPFSACGRNIKLASIRDCMKTVSNTLRAFYGDAPPEEDVDREILSQLGEPTDVKKWLAASLDKTLRLQLGM